MKVNNFNAYSWGLVREKRLYDQSHRGYPEYFVYVVRAAVCGVCCIMRYVRYISQILYELYIS